MFELIFVISSSNRNSFASLCGALDKNPKIVKKFKLKFVEQKDVLKNTVVNRRQIFCFSFQTPDVFRIQPLIKKN